MIEIRTAAGVSTYANRYKAIAALIEHPDLEAIAEALGEDHNDADALRVHAAVLESIQERIASVRATIGKACSGPAMGAAFVTSPAGR